METHIAVPAEFIGFDGGCHIIIALLDLGDDSIEGFDGRFEVRSGSVVSDVREPIFLGGVVEMHPADGVAFTFLNQVSVDFELAAVAVEDIAVVLRVNIRLFAGFEVDDFDGVAFSSDKVDGSVEDVVFLHQ